MLMDKHEGRYIKGGEGSHWVGCEETHWDCKIAKLEEEITELRAARDEAERIFTAMNIDGIPDEVQIFLDSNDWLDKFGKGTHG